MLVSENTGFFENIKSKLGFADNSFGSIGDLIVAFLFGFLFGFVIKNFGRPIFFVFCTILISLWLLSSSGFIAINFDFIYSFLGITATYTFADFFSYLSTVIKNNIITFVIGTFGFIFAWGIK